MDLLSRNRILTAGIIALTLLNIAVLATLWWQNTRPPLPRPAGRAGGDAPGEFMVRRLALTGEQQQRFGELRTVYRNEADSIERDMWAVRRELYDALRSGDAPDTFLVRRTDELGRLEAALQRATFRHFHELRSLCDSVQRPKLDALLRDVFERGSRGLPPVGPPVMVPGGGGERPPAGGEPGAEPPPGPPPGMN